MDTIIDLYLAEEITLQDVVDHAVHHHGMSPAHAAMYVMTACEEAHREG